MKFSSLVNNYQKAELIFRFSGTTAQLSLYSVWLRTGRPGFDPPTDAEDFSSNLCVQTGSGAHPASCTMGTGGSFPGGKARPGRDADHSPPSSAEVKKEWGYTCSHHKRHLGV
jgi:hypothetical protein